MKTKRSSLVVCVLVSLVLGGCLERDLAPIVPCVSQGFARTIEVNPVTKVDLLFVVDDSLSMEQEQASLARNIPQMVHALATGDRDGDGVVDFTPVHDMHAGVISVNMGVDGIPNVPSCETNPQFGDDGILIGVPRVGGTGCMASYPHFLSYDGSGDAAQFATDFTCLARTGTGGCAYEQQLDAPLKALLPSTETRWTFSAGTHGHGDEANAGFLRPDSLVVIIDITDEDDCSTNNTDIWNPRSTTHTSNQNYRCIHYDSELYPIERFVDGFKSLRQNTPNRVIFATITGVPEDLVRIDETHPDIDYTRLFADPRMQNTIVGIGASEVLQPACHSDSGDAAPGIRMARVAQAFGQNGVVQSICQGDYGPALDVVIGKIANQLRNVCLPRKLNPDAMGSVGCDVVETFSPSAHPELDPGGTGTTGRCTLIPGAVADAARVDPDGTVHCTIDQLAVVRSATTSPPVGMGWFYDDFSSETRDHCGADGQRIAFTDAAQPPGGVLVSLECLQRVQGTGAAPTPDAADIGSPCRMDAEPNTVAACYAGAGGPALRCDPMALVCQHTCETSADCPTALSCDDDPTLPFKYCVNPICI